MRRSAPGIGTGPAAYFERRKLDPWWIASLLAPLVLLPLLFGERIGEPVADDYDYLHQVLLSGSWSWLDGGGAGVYWRPLGRQAYFTLLGPWMLDHPAAIALVQAGCLCAAAALLYRAFRPALGPAAALAVSTAPWMMESSRLLIAWPSCFQDLGALLFVALAIHEAVAGRLWSTLIAGLAAMLCKEVAAIALLTLAACPAVRFDGQRRRRTWLGAIGLLVLAWAALYLWVRARAGLMIPGSSGMPASSLAWSQGMALVPWWVIKAALSRPPLSGPVDVLVILAAMLLVPWSRAGRGVRDRAANLRGWWAWGLLWTVPLTLTLVPFYPGWGPYRVAFVGFGLLAAATVTLGTVHRLAIPAFVLVRLGLLALGPAPVRSVSVEPPFQGASIDVPQLSRLQRMLFEVRSRLQARHPVLPPGAAVVWTNFPFMTGHAFGTGTALHVWYRDTTLAWLPMSEWIANPSVPTAAIVEYQGTRETSVALVEPGAMRALLRAAAAMDAGHALQSLGWLARAESLQADTSARVFSSSVRGKRAYASAALSFEAGRHDEARAHLLALLATHPGDVPGRRMLERIGAARSAGQEKTAAGSPGGLKAPGEAGR